MIPQAPFEPTYRIFNFNTMPLYPILIGLGRFIGIDGSFLLKFWPLGAWALSGSLLGVVLYRMGLPFLATLLISLVFALDPVLRWASVLIRPESLIGLFGMILVLGLTFGFPKRWEPRKLWDPVAALLALGAYCHFNAVHLLFPVVLGFAFQPKRLLQIGAKTGLYLLPWVAVVLYHWDLFTIQMGLQWSRLAIRNNWLDSPSIAISNLFQSMGSPEPWPPIVNWVSVIMWVIFFSTLLLVFLIPLLKNASLLLSGRVRFREWATSSSQDLNLLPSAGWLLGAAWLFHTKPEVWFTYFFHASLWCFVGIASLKIWKSTSESRVLHGLVLGSAVLTSVVIFGLVDVTQAIRLGSTRSWNWDTYYDLISCVDDQLTQYRAALGPEKPFHVWCPTFPDITIELSRRHPDWELTRTNDFWYRQDLAIQHAKDVEAVVVPETVNFQERFVTGPAEQHPEILSTWMLWTGYFLNRLWVTPGWKPNRAICQRGRWQAFLFLEKVPPPVVK